MRSIDRSSAQSVMLVSTSHADQRLRVADIQEFDIRLALALL